MKWGGFIVNGRPYQFFSKEWAILNRLLKDNGIARRGGVWSSFQSSNKGGRRTGTAKRYSRGSWQKKRSSSSQQVGKNMYPDVVRSNMIHDKNPGEHVKATLCLVIYHTIFYSDGNMSRRPFVWLQVRHGYFSNCALLKTWKN